MKSYTLQTTADGSNTLYNTTYQQTYHSKFGALTETKHVFIEATGVAERFAQGEPTRILEVGFGTGLNFLATAAYAQDTPLHYVALEKNWLAASVLAELDYGTLLPEVADIQATLLTWRQHLTRPRKREQLTFRHHIKLELLLEEATQAFIPPLGYDAIYHDAFSPDANPELWTVEFFRRLHSVLHPLGKLATYSAKGTVRRALQTAGFRVEKQVGPPGKREMLVACPIFGNLIR